MKKLKEGTLEPKLARFLFTYRITPQSSTEVSPSELMLGQKIQSHLETLHPDLARKVRLSQEWQKRGQDSHARERNFEIGETVYVRNYGPGDMWLRGKVTGIQGSTLHTVLLKDGRSVRRHTDQLRPRVEKENSVENNSPNDVDDFEYSTRKGDRDKSEIADSQEPQEPSLSPESGTEPGTGTNSSTEPAEHEPPDIAPEDMTHPHPEDMTGPRRSSHSRKQPNRYGYPVN